MKCFFSVNEPEFKKKEGREKERKRKEKKREKREKRKEKKRKERKEKRERKKRKKLDSGPHYIAPSILSLPPSLLPHYIGDELPSRS